MHSVACRASWLSGVLPLALLLSAAVGPVLADDAPTVQLYGLEQGAAYSGAQVPIVIVFNSGSATHRVVQIDLEVDGRLIEQKKIEPAASGAYQYLWDTTALPNGRHTLTVRVQDQAKQTGVFSLDVYVNNAEPDLSPPLVTITSPRPGSIVHGKVPIRVRVSDNVGVKWVLIYVDEEFRAMKNYPPFEYLWDTTKVPEGPHRIWAKAIDSSNLATEAPPVTVFVRQISGQTGLRQWRRPATPPRVSVPSVPVTAEPRLVSPRPPGRRAGAPETAAPATAETLRPHLTTPTAKGAERVIVSPRELASAVRPSLPLPPTIPRRVERPRPADEAAQPMADLRLRGTAEVTSIAPQVTTRPPLQPALATTGPTTLAGPEVVPPVVSSVEAPPLPRPVGPAAPLERLTTPLTRPLLAPPRVAPAPPIRRRIVTPPTVPEVAPTPLRRAVVKRPLAPPKMLGPLAFRRPTPAVSPLPAPSGQRLTVPGGGLRPTPPVRVSRVSYYGPARAGTATMRPPQVGPALSGQRITVPAARRLASPLRSASPVSLLVRARGETFIVPPEGTQPQIAQQHVTTPASYRKLRAVPLPSLARRPATGRVRPIGRVHVVQPGETLYRIAQRYHTTVATLVRLNRIARPNYIRAGQRLVVPRTTWGLYFDGQPVATDVLPFVERGISVAPFRHVFEFNGGYVQWIPETKEVHAQDEVRTVHLKIGSHRAQVNEETILMDLAAFIEQGRTMVPVRFIGEALDVTVEVDPASGNIYIRSNR